MTKKLVWRLKEQPTTESLRELVKDKILTNEEAREILFSSEEEKDRDKKSLESEIKFLRELVEKLSKGTNQIIETIRYVEKPYRQWGWYEPYKKWQENIFLCQGNGGLNSGISNQLNTVGFSNINTF